MAKNIFHHLISFYTKHAYTDNYIFGFTMAGMVYAVTVLGADSLLPYVMKLDKASRGQGYALRFNPDKTQKALLMEQGDVTPICSVEFFEDYMAQTKYNRGEIFEKLVTEQMFGQVWEKDNIPYTDAGDVEDAGIAYQIKYEKATFTNEKTANNMR